MPHFHVVRGDDESPRYKSASLVVERFELVVRTPRKLGQIGLGQIELARDDCTLGAMIDRDGAKLRIVELVRSDDPEKLAILVVEPE
jgi:hypothetical protein